MKNKMYGIAIIGSGVAGYAAAMYAGRFRMKTVMFGDKPGGTIVTTDIVKNYPGFKSISGHELAEKIRSHALEYVIEEKEENVIDVKKESDHFIIRGEKTTVKAKTVLFATGTVWRKLGVPGEQLYANRGVHYCALCDAAFYKNKTVAVIGGSDAAAKGALVLTAYAKKVYIIYRKEKIRPEPVQLEIINKKIKEGKIEIINSTNVKEIKGEKFVKYVVLDRPFKGKNELLLDGVFITIGNTPLSELAKKLGVKTNEKEEIVIDRASRTNIRGVFAAGDVTDASFKQAITGVAEAVSAVYSAYNYINRKK